MFNQDYLAFLKWALAHSADLPRLAGLAQEVYDAAGIEEKWHATKALGDAVVPILRDFPTVFMQVEPMSVLETAGIEADVCNASAMSWRQIHELWQVLEPLLPLLLRLIASR